MPSRRRSTSVWDRPDTLDDRLLAALIGGPLFDVGLLLLQTNWRGGIRMTHALLPWPLYLAFFAVGAALGFLVGFRGLIWFFGHLFHSHPQPAEKNGWITLGLWLLMIATALGLFLVLQR